MYVHTQQTRAHFQAQTNYFKTGHSVRCKCRRTLTASVRPGCLMELMQRFGRATCPPVTQCARECWNWVVNTRASERTSARASHLPLLFEGRGTPGNQQVQSNSYNTPTSSLRPTPALCKHGKTRRHAQSRTGTAHRTPLRSARRSHCRCEREGSI